MTEPHTQSLTCGLYLDLMEKVLTGVIIEDAPIVTESFKTFYRSMALEIMGNPDPPEEDMVRYQPKLREVGWDHPSMAFTMVGLRRVQNFRALVEQVIDEGVDGDIMETGVWRGGASIMARAVLKARNVTDRKVILADSFEGLPPPDEAYPLDADSTLHDETQLAVGLAEVQENFRRFGLLDDQVVFIKGWFSDTLPTAPVERLAILRLDGDMYESTLTPLTHLYDRLSPGGFVIVDDYWMPGCKAAVHDFLNERGESPEIFPIDGMGVYFRKA